jgi:hypothetical protein
MIVPLPATPAVWALAVQFGILIEIARYDHHDPFCASRQGCGALFSIAIYRYFQER